MKTTIMANHVRVLLAFCAIQCAMTTSACAFQNATPPSGIANGGTAKDDTTSFEGTWNYDLPNYSKDINISRISCPKGKTPPDRTLFVPQIGSIKMTRTGEHKMLGTTDQGCSWTFITKETALTLMARKRVVSIKSSRSPTP